MRFLIDGPTTIHGSISVAGAKNAALPFLAASILLDAPLEVHRVPMIEDVHRMLEIAHRLGIAIDAVAPGVYRLTAAGCTTSELPADLTPKLRAAIIFTGPLLARWGSTVLPQPGGCTIGQRPIDLFLDGFRAFGVTVTEEAAGTRFTGKPRSARYVFPLVSVTGTETLLLLAVRTPGVSVLENAAMEPEVTALAQLLQSCGAHIEGIGTPTLVIRGVEHLSGGVVTCIPDRIETGAFAALVAACGGSLEIRDCDPTQIAVPLKLLEDMGATIATDATAGVIRISAQLPLRAISIRTHEYPGLPTDLQPPFTVALTQASGLALVHETIYEGRLFYVDKLNKMGANITLCDPHRCLVAGPRPLHGARLESPDIRAGIALLIAAACATGRSVIENVYQIDRGFERIEERLRDIGVRIQREEEGAHQPSAPIALPDSRSPQGVVGY
ncbi:UDP-N-acetylglucosamine 1-carboxyvinyltransferase [Candidatus Uhrbacteria bacterium]|nr:UDP-N-acetylglucosamine 1-carboxyvinyltransferase [Candidatus Uhrbacteria bacterium]